jgi:serine/threonine protein kinase
MNKNDLITQSLPPTLGELERATGLVIDAGPLDPDSTEATYDAVQKALGRRVRLVVLNRPAWTKQDLRHLKSLAKFRHPGAAMLYDAGEIAEGKVFVITEFVEGASLEKVLLLGGGFSVTQTIRVMRDVCWVVKAAHGEGIVHGNLNPSNIMIGRSGEVKVMHFGLYCLRNDGDTVANAAAKVGRASDVYDLGVLFCRMLFVKLPPTGSISDLHLMPPQPKLERLVKAALDSSIEQRIGISEFTKELTIICNEDQHTRSQLKWTEWIARSLLTFFLLFVTIVVGYLSGTFTGCALSLGWIFLASWVYLIRRHRNASGRMA